MSIQIYLKISTVPDKNCYSKIKLCDEQVVDRRGADFQEKAQQRLNEIIKKTGILVIATHSAVLVQQVCNRIIKLERGTLIST